MSDPFLAEIRIFAGNFAPRGWAFCNGQILPIAQNTAIFSIIGTIYGGDGTSTMALPNLQGRSPMHHGHGPGLSARRIGQKLGAETVSITESQIPAHSHTARGVTTAGESGAPSNIDSLGRSAGTFAYHTDSSNLIDMSSQTLSTNGGGQAHTNTQPYLTLNFIIALMGIYPSRG